MHYYVIKPGSNAQHWPSFMEDQVAKISYKEMKIGDVSRFGSREEITATAAEIEGYHKTRADILWTFYSAPSGSILLAGKGRDQIVGIGVLIGDYRYVERDPEGQHQREVDWFGELDYTYRSPWGEKSHLMRMNAFGTIKKYVPVLSYIGTHEDRIRERLIKAGVPTDLLKENETTTLTVRQWTEILRDERITTPSSLAILRAFYDSPDYTNYTNKIDAIVGGKPAGEGEGIAVHGSIAAFVKRIGKYTNYPIQIEQRENGGTYTWPLAFTGTNDKDGQFPWTLRDELAEALSDMDAPAPYTRESISTTTAPLNQILYGPPGTGKTYATIALAVSIANPDFDTNGGRQALQTEYRRLLAGGQVRFTTFHQSLSYEDFVEGLKPLIIDTQGEGEPGDVAYEIKPGIFREITTSAIYAAIGQRFKVRHATPGYREKQAKINAAPTIAYDGAANHVLIIDEINRGNVSAILGELITLLEPSKRLGAAEELRVTLPYSRDIFGVPPNLYVIGTMNTADRSVETLDAALRRRFVFREVAPDPEVIREVLGAGSVLTVADLEVDLPQLLTVLNRRIVALRDADHQLGHSYFLTITDWVSLRDAFCDRMLPLLREYFFATPGDLQLIVGQGFCQRHRVDRRGFAPVAGSEDVDTDGRTTYTFPTPATEEALADCLRALHIDG